jgi:hypothetical protein
LTENFKKNLLIIQNPEIFCLKTNKRYNYLINTFKNKTEKINKVKIKQKTAIKTATK